VNCSEPCDIKNKQNLNLRFRCSFEFGDVDFFHSHHGLHGFWVFDDELGQAGGDDLPSDAELVFEPAALDLFAAFGEFGPVVVDFLLSVAADDEGDGLGEFKSGATVEGGEFLAFELEGDGETLAGGLGWSGWLLTVSILREFLKTVR
jgi:hypothetical protein